MNFSISKYAYLAFAFIGFSSLPMVSHASTNMGCDIKYNEANDSATFYFRGNSLYLFKKIKDSRYGDSIEVYDLNKCEKIAGGSADKSNFQSVMAKNNYDSIYIYENLNFVDPGFNQHVTTSKSSKNLTFNIYRPEGSSSDAKAAQALKSYISDYNYKIGSSAASGFNNKNLVAMIKSSKSDKYKVGYYLATNQYNNITKDYNLLDLYSNIKEDDVLGRRLVDAVAVQGSYDDLIALAESGNKEALKYALKDAPSNKDYLRAEAILVNSIKDNLFNVSIVDISDSKLKNDSNSSLILHEKTVKKDITKQVNVCLNDGLNVKLSKPYDVTVNFTLKRKYSASDYGTSPITNTQVFTINPNTKKCAEEKLTYSGIVVKTKIRMMGTGFLVGLANMLGQNVKREDLDIPVSLLSHEVEYEVTGVK